MTPLVRAALPSELPWLQERVGCDLTPKAKGIVLLDARGIRGMVAYDNWTHNAVQLHLAVESPVAFRHLLGPMFEYPFVQGGFGLLWSHIVAHNQKSRRIAKSIGFRETHRLRDGWKAGVDLVCVEIRREEWEMCRSRRHGTQNRRAA